MTHAALLSPALWKEIRALLPLWAASIAAVAGAFVWQHGHSVDLALFAYVAGSLAIGAQAVGQEYAYRTLPVLLSQPADRRRVYLLKFVVSTLMLLTLGALASALFGRLWRPESARFPVLVLPVVCSLFLAPLLTMICRSTIAGMVFTGSVIGLTWFITLAIAWFGFGIEPDSAQTTILGRWTLGVIAVSALAGFFGWRRFAALEATEAASPALHLPQWLKGTDGARRHSPFRALALKEIHLQQLAFAVAGLYIIGWMLLLLGQHYIPAWSKFPVGPVMLLYCMGLAIVIGAVASAEERQHGTLDSQLLQPTPARQQWIVKAGITLSLALLFGVGLPLFLNMLTPIDDGAAAGIGFRLHALRLTADLMIVTVLLTASSLYLSSVSGSAVSAMVVAVPAGLAVGVFVQIVSGAFGWVTLKVAGPWMAAIVTGAVPPSSIHPLDFVVFALRAFALTFVPVLLWFGFVNHRSSERPVRRLLQQVASIAALIAMGVVVSGGVLAFYELHPR